MSYRAYSTPSTSAQVANLLREAQRAIDGVQLFHPKTDLDQVRSTVEDLLDTLASLPSSSTLACADCGEQLPEFRQRRWYHADPNGCVFDILCRSCESTREDKEADAEAFRRGVYLTC